MNWISVSRALPAPGKEVLVWIDGHRGPCWSNNHARVAYCDSKGIWRCERDDNNEIVGVLYWSKFVPPSA